MAEEVGSTLKTVSLADTMGWADPELIHRVVGAVRNRWPDLRLSLHLHDTRGLAIANVYAALQDGIDLFDTAVGGLGAARLRATRVPPAMSAPRRWCSCAASSASRPE